MGSMAGKRCIVTGGTRGLGLAIACELARQGATQIAITYSKDAASAAKAEAKLKALGASPLLFQGSVADRAHVAATVRDVAERWGGIDVLVNNAGILQVMPAVLVEERDWDAVIDVNVKGTFLFSQQVLRHMLKARSGAVLNIGTFSSERVIESPVHYAASKAAVRGLTESMAKEVGRYGVRVNCLAPGALDEGVARMLPAHRLQEYLDHCALGRVGTAEEVARFAVFLVSEDASFTSASKTVLDGGV